VTALEAFVAALNVAQVVALAYMADRSRQRRNGDDRRRG
jgi:hypothetical protein